MPPKLTVKQVPAPPHVWAGWLYPVADMQDQVVLRRETPFEQLLIPEQVHGSVTSVVQKSHVSPPLAVADGVITNQPGVGAVVRSADCVPIIGCDPTSRWVGAVHAGWPGLFGGAVIEWVESLVCHGVEPANIHLWIGPHAKSCCYEIGGTASVHKVTPLARKQSPEAVLERNGRTFLDLEMIARTQLMRQGVRLENIRTDTRCTIHDSSGLPSWRRTKIPGKDQSIVGVIGWLPEAM